MKKEEILSLLTNFQSKNIADVEQEMAWLFIDEDEDYFEGNFFKLEPEEIILLPEFFKTRNLDILYKINNGKNNTYFIQIISKSGRIFIKQAGRHEHPRICPGHHFLEETLFHQLKPNLRWLKSPFAEMVKNEIRTRRVEEIRRNTKNVFRLVKLQDNKQKD